MDGETLRMLAEVLEALEHRNGTLVLARHPGRWGVTVTRGGAEGPDAHQGPRGAGPRLRDALAGPHGWLCPPSPPPGPPGAR